jgi:hypothetical protein
MTGPGIDNVRAALKVAAQKTVAVREAAEAEAARLHAEREATQADPEGEQRVGGQ